MTTGKSMLPRTIAVLGGGPRGIAVVERLIANAQQLDVPRLHILLVEPHRPGGGRIWDADQPSHLLMNTLCADATHFTDETVELRGPVRPGPTLYDWAQGIVAGEITDLGTAQRPLDEEHRDEATRMLPHSHPSRRFLGGYLEWCHAKDLSEIADGHRGRHRVRHGGLPRAPGGRGWRIGVHHGVLPSDPEADPSAPDTALEADSVVIATGHSDTEIGRAGAVIARVGRPPRTSGTADPPVRSRSTISTRSAPGSP